ncbi:MAG: hypothetical protein FJ138_03770 [Deltaproteobacteria bacterium]|nr:hypothetical protein [Deltaproteobacteria bacterium]
MSAPPRAPLWLLAAPGAPEERAALLAALARRGEALHARARDLPALRRALARPWEGALGGLEAGGGAREGLGGDLEGALAHIEERSAQLTAPWTHAARLTEAGAVVRVGRFALCLDDSLIGAPRTLLLHWGAEPLYRVAPPALTVPSGGPLSCLRVEEGEGEGLLTLRVTLCGALLAPTAGPWALTARG